MTISEPEIVTLATASGPMQTQIFKPAAAGKFPGVILYSEIFQITAPIRRTAAYLAGHGLIVAVPEIYHEFLAAGTVLKYDTAGAEQGNHLKTAKPLKNYDDDSKEVLDHLALQNDCTGNLGAIGICLGGHLAFRCAFDPRVKATACFYATDIHKRGLGAGMSDDSLDRMKEIKGELLMIWGRQDPHVPRDGRRIIYDAMTDAKLNFTWHEFNGQHAFMRDEGARFDPELSRTCMTMVIDLFREHLR